MTKDNTSVDELREILKDFDRVRSGDNSWIAMDRSVAKLRKFINSYTKQRELALLERLEENWLKGGKLLTEHIQKERHALLQKPIDAQKIKELAKRINESEEQHGSN